MSQRLKGQEISVIIVADSNVEDTFTNVKDFELEPESEIKVEGYLGEKTNRKDDIFNGVKGKLTLHLHDQAWFVFQQKIIARQKRDTPDLVFNISAVLAFPNGQTPTLIVPDVKFGATPLNISDRGSFVAVTLPFEADDFDVQYQ